MTKEMLMPSEPMPQTAALPLEAKRGLLASLARDLLSDKPGPLSIKDELGELIVMTVSKDAREKAARAIAMASESELAELRRRAKLENKSISLDEAMNLPFEPGECTDQSP